MPTNTYVALATQTFTSSTASITFSSIPQGYTDLIVVASLNLSGFEGLVYRCNGDTGTNYSATALYGTGSVSGSFRQTNGTYALFADGTSSRGQFMLQFQNYSNTTTNKTALSRSGFADRDTQTYASMWRSTAAINSITLFQEVNNFTSGTISLYGVAAASVGAKATGGTIYSDSSYWYHVFTGNGTFTPSQALTVDYLVVAGGGAGGFSAPGGGGAGGVRCTVGATGGGGALESPLSLASGTNYTVTIGAGGAFSSAGRGASGSNSVFASITSLGGGGGGGGGVAPLSGGSGGGGIEGGPGPGAAGTTNQGYAGGTGNGGGGGAGAVGFNGYGAGAGLPNGGIGGAGITTSISGTSTTYASGGSAYVNNGGPQRSANPASGGGGGASVNSGVANTGGGGAADYGSGGSGVVIVRYAK